MRRWLKLGVLLVLATLTYELFPKLLSQNVAWSSFGGEAVIFLQHNISTPVLDWLMFLIYSVGYIIIIYGTGGYLLWKRDYPRFARYLSVFFIVQTLGVITWALHPVAPPRMVLENDVRDIRSELGGFTEKFNPYPYGAFPSLHVANALTGVLFMRFYGRKEKVIWLFIFLTMSFSTVYLGEHYWQDVAGGVLYSLVGYCSVSAFSKTKLGSKIFSM